MRSIKFSWLAAICIGALPVLFSACVKDNCRKKVSYKLFTPVYKEKAVVLQNIKSNPARELGNTGKMFLYGNYIFLNEVNKGVHVIDNTNPQHPQNIAFIDIPGDVDLAVKGNTLYADMYGDLVAIDITDPTQVVLKKTLSGIFPERMYENGFVPNPGQVIIDWIERDTVVTESCETGPFRAPGGVLFFDATAANVGSAASATVGISGSMARFSIVNDILYAVDRHTLRCINIAQANDPAIANTTFVGFDIETIYPFRNKLFIGSMGGMYIYDISQPSTPVKQADFIHARACDPVIADDNYAYITLRAGTFCGNASNELQIVNVSNILAPVMTKTYPMSGPYGLGKSGNLLFICDGAAGLKVYNAADVNNLQLIKIISGMETYDVIAWNNRAILVAKDGLYQYDYSDAANIRLLSKIEIHK